MLILGNTRARRVPNKDLSSCQHHRPGNPQQYPPHFCRKFGERTCHLEDIRTRYTSKRQYYISSLGRSDPPTFWMIISTPHNPTRALICMKNQFYYGEQSSIAHPHVSFLDWALQCSSHVNGASTKGNTLRRSRTTTIRSLPCWARMDSSRSCRVIFGRKYTVSTFRAPCGITISCGKSSLSGGMNRRPSFP